MKVSQACKRDVACVPRDASLSAAAELMRERHVGSLVVVDNAPDGKPVGILTDRDIVLEVVAPAIDPRTITAGEIMSSPVFTARLDDDFVKVAKAMRIRGVRRIPVVDEEGCVAGILSLEEVIDMASDLMQDIASLFGAERRIESWARR